MFIVDSPSGSKMVVNGKEIINYSGCSYLGISDEESIIDAGVKALKQYGSLCQTPRHYGFNIPPYLEVVKSACDFFEVESATYFSTGYLFGNIVLQALKEEYDVIFLDEKAHYSITDGAYACEKPIFRFKHTDSYDLEKVLENNLEKDQIPIIATDGMFPTYGNIPPLNKYYEIISKYNGWIVVDESHSFGTVGNTGKGAIEKFNLPRDRVIGGGSMAKAFCAYGGLVLGSKKVIDLVTSSAPFWGTSSGMSASAAMTAESLKYVKNHPELLIKLRENIHYLKKGLNDLGINVEMTETPVATFVIGDSIKMKSIQKELFNKGVCITYSNYIGAGKDGVLKFSIFASHTKESNDKLLSLLKEYV